MNADEEFATRELNKLKTAAARLAFGASAAYKEEHPDKYQAMVGLFNKGLLDLSVTVRLTPVLSVEVSMDDMDGKRHVFATLACSPLEPGARLIN